MHKYIWYIKTLKAWFLFIAINEYIMGKKLNCKYSGVWLFGNEIFSIERKVN